jgi:hypothetical protein
VLTGVLTYVIAPLVLALLPVILWLSVPLAGTSTATPLWLSVPDPVVFDVDPIFLASLACIGVLAIVMIVFEASLAPFSLHLAHWVFVYVFFFAAPLVQYKIGTFPWQALTSFETNTLLVANTAILLWCLAWILTRALQISWLSRKSLPPMPRITGLGVWLCLALALLSTSYLVLTLGPVALLTRAGYSEALGDAFSSSSFRAVLDKLLRGFPVAAAAGSLWYVRTGPTPHIVRLGLVAASFGLLLVADFPLGSARYWVGAIYIGLLLTLVGRRACTGWPFVAVLVGGLLVLFPFLSTLRTSTSLSEAATYVSGFNFLGPSLATGDFDAYSMVAYTARYVESGPGITHGMQLLGALLFFVPRSLWPGKPIGSGATVAGPEDLTFNNVSSSPVAEGLINFGWPGVVIFAVALCLLFGLLDAAFWRGGSTARGGSLLGVIYPFYIGFAFFVMRGDLLSATAFVVGFSVTFLPLLARLPGRVPRL